MTIGLFKQNLYRLKNAYNARNIEKRLPDCVRMQSGDRRLAPHAERGVVPIAMQFSQCPCPGSPPEGTESYLSLPSSARTVCRLVALNPLLLAVLKINLMRKFYTFLIIQINIILHYCVLIISDWLEGLQPCSPPPKTAPAQILPYLYGNNCYVECRGLTCRYLWCIFFIINFLWNFTESSLFDLVFFSLNPLRMYSMSLYQWS